MVTTRQIKQPVFTFYLSLILLFLSTSALAVDYQITHIYDGDTIKLSGPNGEFKLRFVGIDAPERNQAYGKKSRRAVDKICKKNHAKIKVYFFGMDKYQRYLGLLFCNDINVSLYLTKQGLAWHNIRYSSDINLFLAQREAQQHKKGLWKQPNPTPPWLWRRIHKYH